MKFIIFEPLKEHRKKLMQSVRSHMRVMGTRKLEFECFEPQDVFSQPMPEEARAAFFTLGSMYDLEAARHFGKLRNGIPIIVVSDSGEYGLEGYDFAEYYLLRPFSEEQLGSALRKCAMLRMGCGPAF